MFTIPIETLAYWNRREFPPASPAEIQAINALAGGRFPADYMEFLASYGFVLWEYTVPDTSDYRVDADGQVTVSAFSITYLHDANSLGRRVPNIWRNEPDNGFPMIPPNLIPIGGTAGQDMILMELEPDNGRIWYWPFTNAAWGTPGNTTLGFVANSFTDFINNLRIGAEM